MKTKVKRYGRYKIMGIGFKNETKKLRQIDFTYQELVCVVLVRDELRIIPCYALTLGYSNFDGRWRGSYMRGRDENELIFHECMTGRNFDGMTDEEVLAIGQEMRCKTMAELPIALQLGAPKTHKGEKRNLMVGVSKSKAKMSM